MIVARDRRLGLSGGIARAISRSLLSPMAAIYARAQDHEPRAFSSAVLKGLALGVPETLVDYGQTVRQTKRDVQQIATLETQRNAAIFASGVPERPMEKMRGRLEKLTLIGWYGSIFPLYQLFDDILTYPLYVHMLPRFGASGAYVIVSLGGFCLASVTGLGQRSVEKAKARLMNVMTTNDKTDKIRRTLDASVNSSMWQVALVAAQPRGPGESLPIVHPGRIAQYAAAYAIINSALYVVADSLPVGEWTGFGMSLAVVWSLSGAYSSAKNHIQTRRDTLQ